MKTRQGILVASFALAAVGVPSSVMAKEKPPTVSYDPYKKTTSITGHSHDHNALLDLDKWDYWLGAVITQEGPKNPVLYFSTNTPEWYFFDHAADVDGNELRVIQGSRDVEIGGVHELIGVELTPKYLADHRATGFNLKIMGSKGERVLVVPAEVVSTFETTYLSEVQKAGGFRNGAATPTGAVSPTAGPTGITPSDGAEAAAAKGGFGISFAVLPQGFVLIAVAPGSRAERAKLIGGQIVTAVNGKSVAGMTQTDAIALLRGSTGATTFTVAGMGDIVIAP
jgi:hypothetical protein